MDDSAIWSAPKFHVCPHLNDSQIDEPLLVKIWITVDDLKGIFIKLQFENFLKFTYKQLPHGKLLIK